MPSPLILDLDTAVDDMVALLYAVATRVAVGELIEGHRGRVEARA